MVVLDFFCDLGAEIPLWVDGNAVDAGDLPVSAGLATDLRAYQAWFERTYDLHADRSVGFYADGRALVVRLQQELGPGWRVDGDWMERL